MIPTMGTPTVHYSSLGQARRSPACLSGGGRSEMEALVGGAVGAAHLRNDLERHREVEAVIEEEPVLEDLPT